MMMPRRRRGRLAMLCLALVLQVVAAADLRAEVGSILDPETEEVDSALVYVLLGIGDDPDPIGWLRYNGDTAERKVLNDQGYANGDGRPSIVYNPVSREPVVAWARNSAAGFDVVVSRLSGGAWTPPEVLAGSSADELDPQLVVDPANGDVHLFYWIDDADPRVMHRQAPADLSSWTGAVRVSAASEPACRPYGALHAGSLHVAYEVHDYGYQQSPRQVVLSKQEPNGSFSPEVVAISNNTGEIRPEVHSHSGRLWVDWIDASDELAWIRKDASGWGPIRYEPFVDETDRDLHVRPGIRILAVND